MNKSQYLLRLAYGGCILCEYLGLVQRDEITLHHVRIGEGMAQRASDYLCIPLCREHHQGDSGIHGLGIRGFYSRYKMDEIDLLEMAIKRLIDQL